MLPADPAEPSPDPAMASLVQRVARQALVTFRNPPRTQEEIRLFQENQSHLCALMTEVRAADLRLVPRRDGGDSAPASRLHQPPVTYMHICESQFFSMGVFLLKTGASIPLHDHPDMHGLLKVLYGKVRISCFDRLHTDNYEAHSDSLRLCVLRSSAEFTSESAPCLLSPDRDNLHRIESLDGPSAFMDILAPPYDPDRGRDCHYYSVLGSNGAGPNGAGPNGAGQEVWLREVSQPPDFWCGAEPYPGPHVSL